MHLLHPCQKWHSLSECYNFIFRVCVYIYIYIYIYIWYFLCVYIYIYIYIIYDCYFLCVCIYIYIYIYIYISFYWILDIDLANYILVTLCGLYARQTVSLFWHETKKRPELKISNKTGSGGGKAGPREARGAVGKGIPKRVSWRREMQRGSRQRRGEESGRLWVDCPENVSQQKSERRLLKPDELHRGWANQHRPALVYRYTGNTSCHKTTFLALGADISPYCSFVLFSPTLSLSCIFCGRKEMWDTPVDLLDESRAMNSFGFKKLSRDGHEGVYHILNIQLLRN